MNKKLRDRNYSKARYLRRRLSNLCVTCEDKPILGEARCQECKIMHREATKAQRKRKLNANLI